MVSGMKITSMLSTVLLLHACLKFSETGCQETPSTRIGCMRMSKKKITERWTQPHSPSSRRQEKWRTWDWLKIEKEKSKFEWSNNSTKTKNRRNMMTTLDNRNNILKTRNSPCSKRSKIWNTAGSHSTQRLPTEQQNITRTSLLEPPLVLLPSSIRLRSVLLKQWLF